jgi:hypothetical protein
MPSLAGEIISTLTSLHSIGSTALTNRNVIGPSWSPYVNFKKTPRGHLSGPTHENKHTEVKSDNFRKYDVKHPPKKSVTCAQDLN